MFALKQKTLPASAEELRAALEAGLREALQRGGPVVTIEDRNYPTLMAMRLALDDAVVSERPPRPPARAGAITPALRVENFEITAAPIRLLNAAVDFHCRARGVEIGQAEAEDGNLILLLQNAAEGSIEIATAIADLERLVRAEGQKVAAHHGVTIQEVRIKLEERAGRALAVELEVQAKKLFLSAIVRIQGRLEIDEQLNARLSGLACTGAGALGSLACGFLTPHLKRFDGWQCSLLALPLGEVKLRDVRIAAGAELRVNADFGRAS